MGKSKEPIRLRQRKTSNGLTLINKITMVKLLFVNSPL